MVEPFPPQFFLLLGIDFFLGASVVTIMFDEHFPDGLPYILDLGAIVGFTELVLGPGYLNGFLSDLQFYYSAGFATIASLSILGANLYLVFRKERYLLSGVFAIAATIPSFLAMLYFESSYVNGIQVGLPLIPVVSWSVVYVMFFVAAAILVIAMILTVLGKRESSTQTQSGSTAAEAESVVHVEDLTGPVGLDRVSTSAEVALAIYSSPNSTKDH